MRKLLVTTLGALALAAAPVLAGTVPAQAGGKDAAAFFGGLLLGGALASRPPVYAAPPPVYVAPPPPPVYYGGYAQAHYDWCYARYRSYDAGTNSFQPYGPNPRRACISPYM